MELEKLHILQWDASAQGNGWTIARESECIAGNAPHFAPATCGKEHRLGVEHVQFAGGNLHSYHAPRHSILANEVKHVKLVEERHIVLDTLLI